MNTGRKKSALSYIPGLTNNGVLQLIIFSGTLYVMFALCWAVMMLVYQNVDNFNTYFIPSLSLPQLAGLKDHWWTIITYGLFSFPNSFMEVLSNMLWLYCFGSVVQMLVGPKQVIPLFIYSLLSGGVFYLIVQLLPGEFGHCPPHILGPRAGLMGMAAAAITLTPKYRFYLTETFSIPLAVVAGIFAALMILGSGYYLPVIFMLLGGALMGFYYVKLLQSGYRPAAWVYTLKDKIEGLVTPDENAEWKKHNKKRNEILSKIYEPKTGITQKRIDELLDKINQKGYEALSREEKALLMKASKDQN